MVEASLTVADGVSIATALLLAVGAWFAWRTYGLAATEQREARDEARRAPHRERLDDIYRELKYLAKEAHVRNPAEGMRPDAVVGQQKRLEIALAFVDDPLPITREIASVSPPDEVLRADLIESAAREIAQAIDRA